MIGRLINQQKILPAGEQHRKQQLGLLSCAQCPKRLIENIRRFSEALQFADDAPFLTVRLQCLHEGYSRLLHLRFCDSIREISKFHRCADCPLIGIGAAQQLQKGCLALPVSADESKLPVCIQRKRDMLKNMCKAAFVIK